MMPTASAGYAASATATPATSTIPRTPIASAISARVNQKRIGPRRRGSRGGGVVPRALVAGPGTSCPDTARGPGTRCPRSRTRRRSCALSLAEAATAPPPDPGGGAGRAAVLAGHEQQHDQGDDGQRPREPEDAPGVAEQRERREHADGQQGEGAAAVVEGDRCFVRAVLGHEQPAGAVQQEAGAAEEGEHDERHPQDQWVDVEVPGEAAGDAGDLPVVDGAAEPAEVADLVTGDAGALVGRRLVGRAGGCFGWCRGHAPSLRPRPAGHHRGRP